MAYYNKDLDEIGFKLYEVSEYLKPYIHSYWIVKNENLDKNIQQKILSDGSMGIIINFESPYTIKINNQNFECKDQIMISGPTKYPSYITFGKKFHLLGIRFTPAGAYIFFNKKIFNFLNKHEIIDNLDFSKIEDLSLIIKKNTNMNENIYLIEDFFLKKLNSAKKKNSPWIFCLIKEIISEKGDIDIISLCKKYNISLKQFERKFKEEVGLSPKIYIRIIRLRNVKDVLSSLKIDNLTKTAYDNGFFDQSHFIKEFKFFMNETPKNYFNNKLSQAKFYNYKEH